MPEHLPGPRRRPPFSVSIALAVVLAGCGTPAPTGTIPPTPPPTTPPGSPGPSLPGESAPPAAAVYAEIRAAVAEIRGLEATSAVDPVTIDEAQLLENITGEFDSTQTPAELKDAEDLLITLGLLPAGSSLRQLTLDLQGGQVAGYYSPDKDELFVVSRSGRVGPVEQATYAHEFTHQLQDQNFDLDSLGLDASDQSDRSLGTLALIEGDATYAQSQWMIANLDAEELGELLAASLDPEALEALRRAPAFLRDTATFPYQDGLALVTRIATVGGNDAVDAAFADPPTSTEQVLHPEKYVDREQPIAVTIPDGMAAALGAGWSVAGQDTLGELILRIWLSEGQLTATDARAAAAGWGGDRIALLRGPDGALAVALATEWDSIQDATAFAFAARTAIAGLGLRGEIRTVPNESTTVLIGIGDRAADVVGALTGVGG